MEFSHQLKKRGEEIERDLDKEDEAGRELLSNILRLAMSSERVVEPGRSDGAAA